MSEHEPVTHELTISEMQEAADALERDVARLLGDFSKRYGLAIEQLTIGPRMYSQQSKVPVEYSVEVDIRL